MDSGLGFNIFTLVFLTGTFLAALVTGVGGFAFGIVAAQAFLYLRGWNRKHATQGQS